MKTGLLVPLVICAIAFNITPVKVNAQTITTVAGCGIGDDSLATKAEVYGPMKVAFDNAGNTYIADGNDNRIRKVSAAGIITTFAGTGYYGYYGDGGPATAAGFEDIFSLACDKNGNLLIADPGASVIRKVDAASGIISTFAGTGTAGFNGDGIAASTAMLYSPSDIAVDTSGNIFIADRFNYLVRKVNIAGIITTVGGNGTAVAPVFDGPATASSLGIPFRIAVDKAGNIFVASYAAWHISKIDATGTLSNIAGNGSYGFSGDGGPATAATFSAPCGLALDTFGNIYFSDIDNNSIRLVTAATGIITTAISSGVAGYSGDGGPASAAQISNPEGLSFDANNNLYIADLANNRVRMVNTAGTISTYAGQNSLFGEDYPGVNAEFGMPQNIAADAAGNIYVADIDNHRIRMLNATTGKVSTVAGAGIAGYEDGFSGDGGPATAAHLYYPSAMTFDAAGNLYICDQDNQRIRKVNTSGIISTIAGNGTAGYAGNGTSALAAEFQYPTGIAVDATGNIYICDNNNHRIRKISASGIITTVAGNGVAGFNLDGVLGTSAELNYPADVAVDATGNVYISDQENSRIRKIDPLGIITTIVGTGTAGYSGDGGLATDAQIAFPQGIKIDHSGNLYIADAGNNCVRMVDGTGFITTLAGSHLRGFSGDGGPALVAKLNDPSGVAVDQWGNLYIADSRNYRLREIVNPAVAVGNVKAAVAGASVYPNPATGTINIINAANSDIIISDAAGKEVQRSYVITAKETMDIHTLASGVYMIQVVSQNGKTQVIKMAKE